MNKQIHKFLLNKARLRYKKSILSDFEYLKYIMKKFLLKIVPVNGPIVKDKINLMESKKKTYELLKILNPKIEVLWEKIEEGIYYRMVILKNDVGKPKVLASSKTNIELINSCLKKEILNKEIPIGKLINKGSLNTTRMIYLLFNAKLKKIPPLNNIKGNIKKGRAYIIKDKRGNILFNIMEVFL